MRNRGPRSLPSAKSARFQVPPQPPLQPEVVDPSWILKAVGAVVALGALCSYATLCGLFYAGQWQFVLHPSRTVAQTPAAEHLAFEPVRFGPDVSGQPQLTGWWVPSDLSSDPTVLLLHSETGSMTQALPAVKALHNARLNVLVFDYRGYGASTGAHPTQALMEADTDAAFTYLTSTRHVVPASLVAYGENLGASLAVRLCAQPSHCAALILQSADGDTLSRVEQDQRSRIIPINLLFHERFPLADPLSTLRTPKLLISFTKGNAPVEAQRAADPKTTAELPPNSGPAAMTPVIRRFLDTYVAHPPAELSK